MRRCPSCFSIYDDATAQCGPCGAATEPHSEKREAPPVPPPDPAVDAGEDDAAAEAEGVVLAEADPAWAEQALEVLSRAGIAAEALLSGDDPPVVAVIVPVEDQERAIDLIGDALDEPPEIARGPSPGDAGEGAEAERLEPSEADDGDSPETPPLDRPPRALDPDQAAFCPECGEAYRAGFERCADCDVPLVPADGGQGA